MTAPATDDQHESALKALRQLTPRKDVNAILEWCLNCMPDMYKTIQALLKGATYGHKQSVLIVAMMSLAFGAGRAYQEANPTAPRHPDGYL